MDALKKREKENRNFSFAMMKSVIFPEGKFLT